MRLWFTGKRYRFLRAVCICMLCFGVLSSRMSVQAAVTEEDMAAYQQLPIESNATADWPQGPVINAESAILMEAETGTILYAKNIHAHEYPASTTKLLTTLIAFERCALDEVVTFSYEAVFDTPRDSNHIAMDVGQALNIEECLNAILIRSANEVSFAVAEHITGTSWQDFAAIMNERAAELGCVDSNFVNPNGLPDENHYTSAYDLAMIGRAFFANEVLCNMTLTPTLHLYPSDRQPHEKIDANKMLLLPGKEYAYNGLVGCKTGYTLDAGNCLVSCAERNGLKLICVVLRDGAPYQYEDTIALLNYGFSNFSKVVVAEADTKYNIDSNGLFYSDHDIFGDSQPLLFLNQEDFIILPATVSIAEAQSSISYDTDSDTQAALISYSYHGVPVGSASVDLAVSGIRDFDFGSQPAVENAPSDNTLLVFINVKVILIVGGIIIAAVLILLVITAVLKNYQLPFIRSIRSRRRNGRRRGW